MTKEQGTSETTQRWFRARTADALGVAVASARRARGDSQDELAERIGASRATISRMERGDTTRSDTILAALAGCGYELVVVPRGRQVTIS